jgi:hypothetical protein
MMLPRIAVFLVEIESGVWLHETAMQTGTSDGQCSVQ